MFTGESYVQAKVMFIENKVAHNTDVSRQFKQVMEEIPTFLGYFQDQTAFEEAKYQQEKYLIFQEETIRVLEEIKVKVTRRGASQR